MLGGVGVFDPGFFFCEILRSLEIYSCPQAAESERLQLLRQFLHCSRNRRVGLTFDGQRLVHDLGGVAR